MKKSYVALFVVLLCFIGASSVSYGKEATFSKEIYLDVMQEAVRAYSDKVMMDYIEKTEKESISEHGYGRLTSNLGILISKGRELDKKHIFKRMMDFCCKDMPGALAKNGSQVGNDFAIKEIVSCIIEIEKAKVFPKEVIDKWKADLSKGKPNTLYTSRPKLGSARARNWAVFGATSEQARVLLGINGDKDYVERYIQDQLRFFDENGMYMDPTQPAVYDLVTRLQFALALYLGYDGASRAKLEELMLKSAELTLYLISATGEIPYGGRSNQFFHNDSLIFSLCEFYATWMKQRGDMEMASRFKGAAKKSVEVLLSRFKVKPVTHVKNFYPIESKYGCENYAYFLKYMVTTGSWAYLAYLFADDSIPCKEPQPKVFVYNTSPCFHWTFLKAGDYSAQFDLNANSHYDASGLGRIHRAGAPSTICLSVPFTDHPSYTLDITNSSPLAIFPVWKCNNEYHDAKVMLSSRTWEEKDLAALTEVCVLRDETHLPPLKWTTSLTPQGVEMRVDGYGDVGLTLPVFVFDGKTKPDVKVDEKTITVTYNGWVCKYETNGTIFDTEKVYGNRNGHYKRYEARAHNGVKVKVTIEPVK
jgi:hypothetical protein